MTCLMFYLRFVVIFAKLLHFNASNLRQVFYEQNTDKE